MTITITITTTASHHKLSDAISQSFIVATIGNIGCVTIITMVART